MASLQDDTAKPIRLRVLYSGRVQGVGFRYTVRSIASKFAVTGFVKNLPDGRVEMVADGASDELARFMAEIERSMRRNIHDASVSELPPEGEFSAFTIAY